MLTGEHHLAEERVRPDYAVYVAGVPVGFVELKAPGKGVVRRWFDRRKREPEGRRSSPLDDVVARTWEPEWTEELIDLLNVLTLVVELEPTQEALLARVLGRHPNARRTRASCDPPRAPLGPRPLLRGSGVRSERREQLHMRWPASAAAPGRT